MFLINTYVLAFPVCALLLYAEFYVIITHNVIAEYTLIVYFTAS